MATEGRYQSGQDRWSWPHTTHIPGRYILALPYEAECLPLPHWPTSCLFLPVSMVLAPHKCRSCPWNPGKVLWALIKLRGPHQPTFLHLAGASLIPYERTHSFLSQNSACWARETFQLPDSRPTPEPCIRITVKNNTDGKLRHFLYNT